MISLLELRNFKAFEKQSFHFSKLNLLTGLNGAGKSSAIQALLLIQQSIESGFVTEGLFALNGTYTSLGQASDALFELADEDVIELVVANDTTITWKIAFDNEISRIGHNILFDANSDPVDRLPFYESLIFLSADRGQPKVHYGVPDSIPPSKGLGIHGEWTVHLLQTLPESVTVSALLAHPNAVSLQVRRQVEAWMGEISPGIEFSTSAQASLDLVQMAYSFVYEKERSKGFRPTNVGFGISYILPVITACLIAEPGDLLIIESPEAHLHPRGQGKMAELLARTAASGVQVVIESHSDHIMNGLRVAVHQNIVDHLDVKFFYVSRDADAYGRGSTSLEIQLDRSGRLSQWVPGFFDEAEMLLEVLLTPKPHDD